VPYKETPSYSRFFLSPVSCLLSIELERDWKASGVVEESVCRALYKWMSVVLQSLNLVVDISKWLTSVQV